jgi:hypothetical protein
MKAKIPWWVGVGILVVVVLSFVCGYYMNDILDEEVLRGQRLDRSDERALVHRQAVERDHEARVDRAIENCTEITKRYIALRERCGE